jgi:large subunit ribosomal protein L15
MPPRLSLSTLRYLGTLEEICYCNCRNGARQVSATRLSPYITSARRRYTAVGEEQERPRWQHTPRDMVAPVRLKTYKPENDYRVNEDPKRLDQVYEQVLGHGGRKLLTEDVKWLAVTHKSFDQGRRGYNDRLAFFGKETRLKLQRKTLILYCRKKDSRFTDLPRTSETRLKFRHLSTRARPIWPRTI